MNKAQKEVLQSRLDKEDEVIKELKEMYGEALDQVNDYINNLVESNEEEQLQSKIYQQQYQESLRNQINTIINNLESNQYDTVNDYIHDSYDNGYAGVLYDLQYQGIPITTPINQKMVVKAIENDTKLSKTLYQSLDMAKLKKDIRSELSRGIATSSSYDVIATNVSNRSHINLYNATRIARTEGHRVQNQASLDAMEDAEKEGANIVKQWDATMDSVTREDHRILDGQIKKINEMFSVNGHKAKMPGGFGVPGEDINCRCAVLQRAKWALDEKELNRLKDRAKYFGLDKTKSFEEFTEKYLSNVTEETVKEVVKETVKKVSKTENVSKTTKDVISEDEKRAIDYYVSGDGMYINQMMRGINSKEMGPMTSNDRALMNDLIKATDRKHSYDTLYRSVDASAVFGNISSSEYDSIRSLLIYKINDKSTSKASNLIDKVIGKEITEKGFMSTTKDKNVAIEFGDFTGSEKPVVIEFTNANNVHGFDLGKYLPDLNEEMEQEEVLLHNDTKYIVDNISAVRDEEYGAYIKIIAHFI